jgi:hypothetical protein
MKTERCQTQAQVRACSWSAMALVESEFHRADMLVEAELGLIVAALAPDIRSTLDAEFVCNKGDVIIAIDPGSASELVRRLSGYPDLVRAAPLMQAARLSAAPATARPAFSRRTALRLSLASGANSAVSHNPIRPSPEDMHYDPVRRPEAASRDFIWQGSASRAFHRRRQTWASGAPMHRPAVRRHGRFFRNRRGLESVVG